MRKIHLQLIIGLVTSVILGGTVAYHDIFADSFPGIKACVNQVNHNNSEDDIRNMLCSDCSTTPDKRAFTSMWIGSNGIDTGNNVISTTSTTSTVKAALRYREYGCNYNYDYQTQTSTPWDVWAYRVWFEGISRSQISWITHNYSDDSKQGDYFGTNRSFGWNTGPDKELTISVKDFKKYVDDNIKNFPDDVKIDDDEQGGAKYGARVLINSCNGYSNAVSINNWYQWTKPTYSTIYNSNTGYTNMSFPNVVYTAYEKGTGPFFYVNDNTDSSNRYTCDSTESWIYITFTDIRINGNGEFSSTSAVHISDEEITDAVNHNGKYVESNGPTATVRFSTNKSNVSVEFSHYLHYSSNDTTKNDVKVSSDWTVSDSTWTKGKPKTLSTTTPAKDTWGGVDANTNAQLNHEASPTRSVLIERIEEGETRIVCSTINYNHKNVSWQNGQQPSYSDNGESSVCVYITRPKPPTGPDPENGPAISVMDSKVMFAGESTDLSWYAKTDVYDTHYPIESQAVKFLVNQSKQYDDVKSYMEAGPSGTTSPCSKYGHISSNCIVAEKRDEDSGVSDEFSKSISVKVPNNVGDKYCNSFGYLFQHKYYISGSSNGMDTGDSGYVDGTKNYWYTFQPSCRTIAKKPSVAVWNGSVMTTGSIVTSLAPRYNIIEFGQPTRKSDDNDKNDVTRTLYGSWSEYLTIANNIPNSKDDGALRNYTNNTMGSGSTLSGGSDMKGAGDDNLICYSTNSPWKTNSPLTISNLNPEMKSAYCQLNPSGISNSSSFLTRLQAYFDGADESQNKFTKINYNKSNVNDYENLPNSISSSYVITGSGDLYISRDIIINSANYNIGELPQVIIIVKGGNIHIDENVTRLDAWIIVTKDQNKGGTLNTCIPTVDGIFSDFTPGDPKFSSISSAFSVAPIRHDQQDQQTYHCSKQLVINGPVVAYSVKLQRTYGADADYHIQDSFGRNNFKGAPAEIFNLRADTYLWAYMQSTRQSSSYNATYSRELAPRY